MTIYDYIIRMDKDTMAEFLYRFARDTIDQFSRFQLPNKTTIMEFLDREKPQ